MTTNTVIRFGSQKCSLATLLAVCLCYLETESAVATNGSVCEVSSLLSDMELSHIVRRNCDKVMRVYDDFGNYTAAGKTGGTSQETVWISRGKDARNLCNRASLLASNKSYLEAATSAAHAWGAIIMNGSECCTLSGPPYCEATSAEWQSLVVFAVLLTLLLGLFLVSLVGNLIQPAPVEAMHLPNSDETSATSAVSSSITEAVSVHLPAVELHIAKQLEEMWMRSSSLRVLPGAHDFAKSATSLFAFLHRKFDFQSDSVRNQYEHLLSMWRSHCAMVADRSIGDARRVNEDHLLAEALGDLHVDLLDGFCRWRSKFAQHESSTLGGSWPEKLPLLGDGQWNHVQSSHLGEEDASHLTLQLAQVATYLLVWGEAGNLRFMPEVIYFMTEMVLSAELGYHQVDETEATETSHEARSCLFLAKVVRPMYNAVFDEWYDYVDIDTWGRDKKKLHSGLDAFLPADVANYDDWNELFCDPQRLMQCLLLKDGSRLFSLPHGRRFAALADVNWKESLKSTETKTHREMHSCWGLFAATHRIWLIHATLFFTGICMLVEDPPEGSNTSDIKWPVEQGRFAALGLIVPIHSMLWFFARWQVTGRAFRWKRYCGIADIIWTLILMAPLPSYVILVNSYQGTSSNPLPVLAFNTNMSVVLTIHYTIVAVGLLYLLLIPSANESDKMWPLTDVPWTKRLVRYVFWLVVFAVKFCTGLIAIDAMLNVIKNLGFAQEGYEAPRDLGYIFTVFRVKSYPLLQWLQLWLVSFLFYITDTQLWFTICATVLGVSAVFVQRGCHCASFMFEDAIAKIPERFSQYVIPYVPIPRDLRTKKFSREFALLWDRIVEYMRYEDDIDHETIGSLSFASRKDAADCVTFGSLSRELKVSDRKHVAAWKNHEMCTSGCGFRVQPGLDLCGRPFRTCCKSCAERPGHRTLKHDRNCRSRAAAAAALPIQEQHTVEKSPGTPDEERLQMKLPGIFQRRGFCEILWQTYGCVPNQNLPSNADVQWRILALSRGLGLPMPRPFQAPYIPGLTVLIPHYGESIIMHKADLYQDLAKDQADGMVIDFLKYRWNDEFRAFTVRMQATRGDWPAESGGQWDQYTTEAQWRKLGGWCSMRMQTLWRTVAGMCMYHPALQCHYEVQAARSGPHRSRLTAPGIWDPSDCFTCLVSMQMYKYFDKEKLDDTKRMLEKFPDCLKIAFIDSYMKGARADADSVHPMQRRRYYSCLIDRDCQDLPDGRKKPIYRIELPGYPILGDGKGDNQNHAIPFMRGTFSQCIDANQGAYFEQMLLLPCVLGEFRSKKRGDDNVKKIVGFPEHITSDIGSVGDMAASAEFAFGTILQRSYSVLGARMHYGHPDIMNKYSMMQQGGVSKATKTMNLSEDIFAGMDFTLRGDGRSIHHAEYFHLAKGRDLGFNTVLGFFSKLASGAGEQILTRQMFRLGQLFHLPECLTFFYAHVGYYLNQFLVSWSLPLLVHVWLLVLLADCESSFKDFQACNTEHDHTPTADVMAKAFTVWFSILLFLFLIANSLPLFLELWMERDLKTAIQKLLKQLLTLSPLLFVFQAKVIGSYVVNELRLGGAQYINTGRGLPTERRPFLGELRTDERGRIRMRRWGGLYLDYASIAYYDGAALLIGTILVRVAGGTDGELDGPTGDLLWLWVSLAFLITSWLFAPFIYNPHQFRFQQYMDDLRSWFAFFVANRSKHWMQWYEKSQLKLGTRRRVPIDIAIFLLCFFVLTWYELLSTKVEAFASIYSETSRGRVLRSLAYLPPIGGSIVACIVVLCVERMIAGISFTRQWLKARQDTKRAVEDDAADVERPADPNETCRSRAEWHVVQAPLILVSVCVVLADIAETIIALYDFVWVEWNRALIAGVIFKYAMLSTVLCLSEEVLRFPSVQHYGHLCQPLKLFVYAHRMARDLLTSSFILVALSPCVLFDSLNSCCCHGFSVHHLLIYRDPGRPARENLDIGLGRGRTQMWRSGLGSHFSFWKTTEKSEITRSEMEPSKSQTTRAKSRFVSETEVVDRVESDLIGAQAMFYHDEDYTASVEIPGSDILQAGVHISPIMLPREES